MEDGEAGKKKYIRLIFGAIVFAAGMLSKNLFATEGYMILAIFAFGYLLLGGEIIFRAAKNIAKGDLFDENFLMAIATLGAFAIGEHAEAAGVMLFYQLGELLQDSAVNKSKKTIARLMDIRPDYANLREGEQIKKVSPETVNAGDVIIVRPGEKVPLDGIVLEGESFIDSMALTGEPVPRRVSVSDAVFSGCVNKEGLLSVKVTHSFGQSTASKIIELALKAADKKAPTENFIAKFAKFYTPAVVALATLIAAVPPLAFGGLWLDWLNRGLIFLVISCPCALVISIPLGFFGGIGGASRKGILVKGGNYLEALENLDLVVFDKTGTLTKGAFEVSAIYPANGSKTDEVLETAAKAEAFSNHPIALSIMRAYGKNEPQNPSSEYSEIAGYGVSAKTGGKVIFVGNEKLMDEMGIEFDEIQGVMGTKAYVAADGEYIGCIVISDEVKPDSRYAIEALRGVGVKKIAMLTGDSPQAAETIANELKIDEAFGGLLPWQKVEKLEMLNGQRRKGGKLAFVGDGINDAPVLAMSDVGVAMGGLGSDAAIEAADVVLMTDEPSKLAAAVKIARFTKRIVWQNIVFALAVKFAFLLFGALGMATMWEAVFADVGVALLAVLNAMRATGAG